MNFLLISIIAAIVCQQLAFVGSSALRRAVQTTKTTTTIKKKQQEQPQQPLQLQKQQKPQKKVPHRLVLILFYCFKVEFT